ncbi:winged helix DNA-binding protein [Pseudomaricurvus alkylphenolicus]|jgi:predicted MarR family transcription regulator|uniref:winged helix DNA-binding protein n=1 Tax=Pseudomaricurvus alkylphenolicus TaxID=1306991 RepID=UPI00141FD25E|nr:winged helix DNA-binding protein [Pseudomaricurvus alkylphenolicus]NIB42182.1 winged helix DNA-binding protein [Pseudomaricurvus alkylphenolicus]
MHDKHWHMATNEHEVCLTEFEFALLRVNEAFNRWMDDCAACSSNENVNGMDFAVLNIIHMHDRPKGITEISRLMNREDTSNMQYCIRKLMKADLIEKVTTGGVKKGATYQVTEAGKAMTSQYVSLRKNLLLSLTAQISNSEGKLEDASQVLNLMSGLYNQASCLAATHRLPSHP